MPAGELRKMRACEVYDGDIAKGENYLYTHLPKNPYDRVVADRIRIRAEQLGMSSNSIYPAEEPTKLFRCDECGRKFDHKIALAGHQRTHKTMEAQHVRREE